MMAQGMVGADVAQLRQLAGQFDQGADDLFRSTQGVNQQIQSQFWCGPVATRFRGSWQSVHQPKMGGAVQALREAAQALRRNADDQERTSRNDGGAVSSTGGGPIDTIKMGLPEHPPAPPTDTGSTYDPAYMLGGLGSVLSTRGDTLDWLNQKKILDLADGPFTAFALAGDGLSLVGDGMKIADLWENGGTPLQWGSAVTGTAGDVLGTAGHIVQLAKPASNLVPGLGIVAGIMGAISDASAAEDAFSRGDTVSCVCNAVSAVGNLVSVVGAVIPPPAGLAVSVVGGLVSGAAKIFDFFW